MSGPSHMIASLDAALAEYTAGIDRAVRFVTIDQVDMLAEFYLHNRSTPDPAQIRADALREAIDYAKSLEDELAARARTEGRLKEAFRINMLRYCNPSPSHTDIDAVIAACLIDAPPSPPAVDNSPAPDAGTKGQDQ